MKNNALWKRLGLTAATAATFGLVSSGVFLSVNGIAGAAAKEPTAIEADAEAGSGNELTTARADAVKEIAPAQTDIDREKSSARDEIANRDDSSLTADEYDDSFWGNLFGTEDRSDGETAEPEEAASDKEAASDGEIASTKEANESDEAAAKSGSMTVAEVASNSMPAMVAITNTSTISYADYFGGYGDFGSIYGDLFGNYGDLFGNYGGLFGNNGSYGQYQDYGNYGGYGDGSGAEAVSMGSGVIINETDDQLIIVTNQHVINGANDLSVAFIDETTASAEILGEDASTDLAVIAVNKSDLSKDTISAIRVIEIGNSDELKVGEPVVAIGNALGYGQSVSTGIVSAMHRTLESYSGQTEGTEDGMIQTDAAINPGNSGGALLNMRGELIGINSAKYADTDVEGMGYAIPITSALPILESLQKGGTANVQSGTNDLFNDNTVRLGITCTGVSEEYSSYYGIPAGVYIKEVDPGSAAANAGIKAGDIITAIDDVTVKSVEDLTQALTSYKPGDSARVTVSRETAQPDIFSQGTKTGEYVSGTTTVTFAAPETQRTSLNDQ